RARAQELRDAGDWDGALAEANRFLALALGGAGLTTDWTAAGYALQASLEADRGNFAEARSSYQAALAIKENLYGTDHPDAVDLRLTLAELDAFERLSPDQRDKLAEADRLETEYARHVRVGRLPEAEDALQGALGLRAAAQGTANRDYARVLNNLGQ